MSSRLSNRKPQAGVVRSAKIEDQCPRKGKLLLWNTVNFGIAFL